MTFYPAQIGGPNNTLYWHTDHLNLHGIQPIIITSDIGIEREKKIITDKWFHQGFGKIIYRKIKYTSIPFEIIFLSVKNFKKSDIIHFNGLFNKATVFLIFIAAIYKKPIVLSPRGELLQAAIKRKKLSKVLVLKLYSLIKKKILFHATSLEEKDSILNYFGHTKIVLQPNFIKANYCTKNITNHYNFLLLGRINPIKNIHLLIEGASKSKAFMKSNAKIVIAGKARLPYENDYLNELIQQIANLEMKEKIIFKGHVESDVKENLIKDAYFLILPSKSENFGNVVLEALVKGTPVIASTGTPWELLEKCNAGYWIKDNLDSIKSTIENALALTPQEYNRMSRNALKLVETEFDINSKKKYMVKYL